MIVFIIEYKVSDVAGTRKLIEICNGHIFLIEIISDLRNVLEVYNSYKSVIEKIPFNDEKRVPGLNDHWLAGFLDSKASFSGTKNANNLY